MLIYGKSLTNSCKDMTLTGFGFEGIRVIRVTKKPTSLLIRGCNRYKTKSSVINLRVYVLVVCRAPSLGYYLRRNVKYRVKQRIAGLSSSLINRYEKNNVGCRGCAYCRCRCRGIGQPLGRATFSTVKSGFRYPAQTAGETS